MEKTKIIAGGGLVFNESDELLMIYRRGKWDLPKGKLDDGETINDCALREVKEETGLADVEILEAVGITYHDYFDKYLQKEVIKEVNDLKSFVLKHAQKSDQEFRRVWRAIEKLAMPPPKQEETRMGFKLD